VLPESAAGDEAVAEDGDEAVGEDGAGAAEDGEDGEDGAGAGDDGEDGAGEDGDDGAGDDGAGDDEEGAGDDEEGAGEDDDGAGEDDDGAGDEEAGCEVADADADALALLDDTAGAGVIGVGGRDEPMSSDEAGLRYARGETGIDFEGAAEDDASGMAGGLAAEDGAVTTTPAPACGWRELSAGDRFAPIKAKAATPEPATSPPVMHAEASVRETRCRPGWLASRYKPLPEDAG
jgi:hypothetical protein